MKMYCVTKLTFDVFRIDPCLHTVYQAVHMTLCHLSYYYNTIRLTRLIRKKTTYFPHIDIRQASLASPIVRHEDDEFRFCFRHSSYL
jgi:hypothetical protein